MSQRTLRPAALAAIVLLLLALGVFAWNGLGFWFLSQQIDTHTREVARFYRLAMGKDVPPLSGSGARLNAKEKQTLGDMRAIDLTENGRSQAAVLHAITDAQTAYMRLVSSVQAGDDLSRQPALASLARSIGKEGSVLPVIAPYNRSAQAWNNKRDEFLGEIWAALLRLPQRRLLNTEGKLEYETKVNF